MYNDLLADLQFPDGRIYEVQINRVCPAPHKPEVVLTEIEVREKECWFNRYFNVYIYVQELEDCQTGEELAAIGRREVANWLHNNRMWPDNSNEGFATIIHFPPRPELPYFP